MQDWSRTIQGKNRGVAAYVRRKIAEKNTKTRKEHTDFIDSTVQLGTVLKAEITTIRKIISRRNNSTIKAMYMGKIKQAQTETYLFTKECMINP